MQLSEVILSNPLQTLFWSCILGILVTGLIRGFLDTLVHREDW